MRGPGLAASCPDQRSGLEPVQRTVSWPEVSRHDRSVQHSGLPISRAEPCLAHAAVSAALQYRGRTPVVQHLTAPHPVEPGLCCSAWHRRVQAGCAPLMPPRLARARLSGAAWRLTPGPQGQGERASAPPPGVPRLVGGGLPPQEWRERRSQGAEVGSVR
jgi:hypothetical protein